MAETIRAKERRIKEGFFEKYIDGKTVIDIGCGRLQTHDGVDSVCEHAEKHDSDICDAHIMDAYGDESFDTVYASHILEHLSDPVTAIQNWWRICKPGGSIIISIPHRDLYERKRTLPSKWNLDHKYFYLPYHSDPPHTFSILSVIDMALKVYHNFLLSKVDIQVYDTCTNHDKPEEHPNGEMSIEVIISKS